MVSAFPSSILVIKNALVNHAVEEVDYRSPANGLYAPERLIHMEPHRPRIHALFTSPDEPQRLLLVVPEDLRQPLSFRVKHQVHI